jgi:hypothetical protein
MANKQDFVRSLNAAGDRYGGLEDKTVKQVQSMLKALRGQISAEVGSLEGYEAFRLKRLQANIARLIDRFDEEAARTIHSSMQKSSELGDRSVLVPMKRIGLDADKIDRELDDDSKRKLGLPTAAAAQIQAGPMGVLTPQQAIIAVDYSADLIKSISDEMRAKINTTIRLGIVGVKKPVDLMRDLTDVLGVSGRHGIWKKRPDPVKGIAARSETILRTEMQRAYNLAHHSQQKRVQKLAQTQNVRVLKGWTATADMRTRQSHLDAHRKYSTNPIPVDEPFILRSKTGKDRGPHKLMYPGDPNGPAHETINCRCKTYSTTDRIGAIGSSLDGRISQELERRGT